jgi:predicted esterase
MLKKILTFLTFLTFLTSHAQQVAKQIPVQLPTSAKGHTIGFLEYRPPNYGSEPLPLIIFLHGLGERGTSITVLGTDAQSALAVATNDIPKILAAGGQLPFVVLSPQLYSQFGSWQNWYVDEMLAYAKKNLKIDTTRRYLTGISLGGGGTWRYASTSVANASQFAAIAPVCGTCDWADLCNITKAGTQVWAFHAQDDHTVSVNCTNSAINALLACSPSPPAAKSIYVNGDHWIWPRSYDTTNTWHYPNLYQWFLMHRRTTGSKPVDPVPVGLVASAGPDQSVTGTTATLDGSASKGYPNTWDVFWEIVKQPANSNWDIFPNYDKTGINKTLKNLSPGEWRFKITVPDGKGGTATDEMILQVR